MKLNAPLIRGLETDPKKMTPEEFHRLYFKVARDYWQRAAVVKRYYSWMVTHREIRKVTKVVDHWYSWCRKVCKAVLKEAEKEGLFGRPVPRTEKRFYNSLYDGRRTWRTIASSSPSSARGARRNSNAGKSTRTRARSAGGKSLR